MTIYTIVGDPHAKPDNLEKINTLFEMIEDLGNPCIILGDLLDTKELIRGKCLDTYYDCFSRSKLEFTLLVGNHDRFSVTAEGHSLRALSFLPNVIVVDTSLTYDDIGLIAYTHDIEKMKNYINWCDKPYVFVHADIQGFDFGNGILSKEGLLDSDFSKFDKVISGHYHKHATRGNIVYLGTPFSHSFGESNQEKYIGIFDSIKGSLELLKTPFPSHVTLTWDASTKHPVIDDTNYNRIIITGNPEQIASTTRLEKVKYIEQPTITTKAAIITESDTPAQQFQKWAKEIKGYSDEVLTLGMEVLKDVQNY